MIANDFEDDDTFTVNDVVKSAGDNLGSVWQTAKSLGQVWDMNDLKADVEQMQVTNQT